MLNDDATASRIAEEQQSLLDEVRGLRVDRTAHERAMRDADLTQPTLAQLERHADRYGPDGVLEAGMHLPEYEWLLLAVYVKGIIRTNKKGRR